MRTRTPVVVLLAAAIGTVACRRGLARMASSTFAGGLALAGYGPFPKRDPIGQQDLLKLRREEAERNATAHRRVLVRLLERIKAEYDRYTAGAQKEPPVLDVLIVSGGGDWGAFGAGFLKGWHKVPAQHPLAKPEFDVVTGVSTGTLIAHSHSWATSRRPTRS
jgi:Patatin-like phospholipase